jgi:hypothetical protein
MLSPPFFVHHCHRLQHRSGDVLQRAWSYPAQLHDEGWFKFFGLAVDPSLSHDTAASQGHYLATLDEKCRLELRFRDSDDGFRGDSWYEGYTSCQSVLVDWVMTFAYEHIKHIKNVDLVGCIKTPQKQMWLGMLAEQRGSSDYNFDHAAAIKLILATPSTNL